MSLNITNIMKSSHALLASILNWSVFTINQSINLSLKYVSLSIDNIWDRLLHYMKNTLCFWCLILDVLSLQLLFYSTSILEFTLCLLRNIAPVNINASYYSSFLFICYFCFGKLRCHKLTFIAAFAAPSSIARAKSSRLRLCLSGSRWSNQNRSRCVKM